MRRQLIETDKKHGSVTHGVWSCYVTSDFLQNTADPSRVREGMGLPTVGCCKGHICSVFGRRVLWLCLFPVELQSMALEKPPGCPLHSWLLPLCEDLSGWSMFALNTYLAFWHWASGRSTNNFLDSVWRITTGAEGFYLLSHRPSLLFRLFFPHFSTLSIRSCFPSFPQSLLPVFPLLLQSGAGSQLPLPGRGFGQLGPQIVCSENRQ